MSDPFLTVVSSLLKENLCAIFAWRDQDARLPSIENLYTTNPTFHHHSSTFTSREAIAQREGEILAQAPQEWTFSDDGNVKLCKDLRILGWRFGPALKEGEDWGDRGSRAMFGTDVILVVEGRIARL